MMKNDETQYLTLENNKPKKKTNTFQKSKNVYCVFFIP